MYSKNGKFLSIICLFYIGFSLVFVLWNCENMWNLKVVKKIDSVFFVFIFYVSCSFDVL